MSTYERVIDEINYKAIKNLLKEGLVTDVECFHAVFKLSKKKREAFLNESNLKNKPKVTCQGGFFVRLRRNKNRARISPRPIDHPNSDRSGIYLDDFKRIVRTIF